MQSVLGPCQTSMLKPFWRSSSPTSPGLGTKFLVYGKNPLIIFVKKLHRRYLREGPKYARVMKKCFFLCFPTPNLRSYYFTIIGFHHAYNVYHPSFDQH